MAETFIPSTIQEFELPTTLVVHVGTKGDGGFGISPGHLTEAQAVEYWDNMRPTWVEHCAQLRRDVADRALGGAPQGLRRADGS